MDTNVQFLHYNWLSVQLVQMVTRAAGYAIDVPEKP